MAIKKQLAGVGARSELIKKATKKGIPSCQESYEKIQEYYAGLEFSAAFTTNVKQEVSTMYGPQKVTSLLRNLKYMYIHNIQTLYTLHIGDKSKDIGTWAYKVCPDDPIKYLILVLQYMSVRRGRGDKDIDLSSVFLYLANIEGSFKSSTSVFDLIDAMVASTICSRVNPFKISIMFESFAREVATALGLEKIKHYWGFIGRFLTKLNSVYIKDTVMAYPKITLTVPVYEDVRKNQLTYLARLFNVSLPKVKEATKDILEFSEDSTETIIALEKLRSMTDYNNLDFKGALKIMKNMESNKKLFSYTQPSKLFDNFEPGKGIPRCVIKRFNITPVYFEKDSFLQEPYSAEAHIEINCSKFETLEQARPCIDDAIILMLLRVRDHRRLKRQMPYLNPDAQLLITLTEVSNYTTTFIKEVKELEKKLRSFHNRNIHLRIQYNAATVNSKFGEKEQKYIRVISDIHVDVNKDQNYVFDFGDDFVINCGDTSGDSYTTRDWIRSYMQSGVVVAGNHLGYAQPRPELNGDHNYKNWGHYVDPFNTKNGQASYLKDTCMGAVKFLSNDIIEENGLIIIGTTLYTDFKLFGEKSQAACMVEARKCINDFRYCTFLEKVKYKGSKPEYFVRDYSVEHHLKLFKICLGYIGNRLEALKRKGNKKPIVIVTHFAPLPYCIEPKYKNDPLSAAFASDLRWFIDKYPEIRLWCSGHVHKPYDFIYKKTRFVAEPWGYFNENNFDIKTYGKRIAIEDIKNKKKAWTTLLEDEIAKGEVQVYKD